MKDNPLQVVQVSIGDILKGAHPEIREMLRRAHEQKFRVTPTSNNHFRISTPEHYREQRCVFAPKTPSDTRGLHRVRAKLRRFGVKLPH